MRPKVQFNDFSEVLKLSMSKHHYPVKYTTKHHPIQMYLILIKFTLIYVLYLASNILLSNQWYIECSNPIHS